MGSRLSRRRSLDNETFSKSGRQPYDSWGDAGGSGSCAGGDFVFASLILKSDKLPGILRKSRPSPYVRRVAWIREMQTLLRENKVEQAAEVLKVLRKDLGLEGTSLNDVLHRNAAFLNLVDPISHELLLSLARDLQCPKMESEPLKSSDKICRQLIYHLTPHSYWLRQGRAGPGTGQAVPKRKSQACLKMALQQKRPDETLDLSGLLLSSRDVHRVARYLHGDGAAVVGLDLSFAGLRDEHLRLLLPALMPLPALATLALNGNRLSAGAARDLTDALKDGAACPSLAWVDLGNNLDIFTLPQPLLLALRRRLGLKSGLPTIYELSPTGEAEEEEEEEELQHRPEMVCGVGVQATPLSVTALRCER